MSTRTWRYAITALALSAASSFAVASSPAAWAAPAEISPLTSASCPTDMQSGEVDGCVVHLQNLLNAQDGAGLAVDGDFGPATQSAVETFQSAHSLSVDGIVGPNTKTALEPSSPPPSGQSTNVDWATLVLQDGGWPASTNNVTVLLQWMASEEPPSNWFNRNNPLNNGLGSGGGDGTGSYPELLTAASYAAQNLSGGLYPDVVNDLAASADPATTASDIWASPWASSHYGYGANWHSGPVDTVAAPASDW